MAVVRDPGSYSAPGTPSRRRHRRRKPPTPVSTVNSTLGGAGVRRTEREAARADRAAHRRRRQDRRQTRARHERQRAELKSLTNTIIPALQQRRNALAVPTLERAFDLTNPRDSARQEAHKAEVEARLAQAQARANELSGRIRQRRGRRAENVTALEAGAALLSALPPVRAAEGAGLIARAVGAIGRGGEAAAPTAVKGAAVGAAREGVEAAARGGVRGAARSVATRAGTAARVVDSATSPKGIARLIGGKGIARGVERGAVRAEATGGKLARAGRATKTVGKGAGRAATFPIRRPVKAAKYTALAQAPVAIGSGDPVESFKGLTEGTGVVPDALRAIGSTVAGPLPEVGENIVKDAFELPAQAIPAVYQPIAGLVEAAGGNSDRLEHLWNEYKASGLLPALAEGDLDKALNNIKEHPLFTGLEASGAVAGIGRGAGAIARNAPSEALNRIGSRQRAPLQLGTHREKPREYSPDLIRKGGQVLADRRRARREGGQKATPTERNRALRERLDRVVGQEEGARRGHRGKEAEGALRSVKPKKLPFRARGQKLSRPEKRGLALGVAGILKGPKTWKQDIATYRATISRERGALQERLANETVPVERAKLKDKLKANEEMAGILDRLEGADPARYFAAARANAHELLRQDKAKAEVFGNAKQLDQARLIPAARVHLGAKYGKPNRRGFDDSVRVTEQKHTAARAGVTQAERNVRTAEAGLKRTQERLAAAKAEGKATARLEGVLSRRKDALARAKQTLNQARQRRDRAKQEALNAKSTLRRFRPEEERLIDRNGDPLNGKRLHDALRSVGVDPDQVGFVSLSPNARGAKNFYRAMFGDRQTMSGTKTTGAAAVEGSFDPSFDLVAEQRIGGRGVIDAVDGFDRLIREFAVGRFRFKNWQAMDNARRHPDAFGFPPDMELVGVRTSPLRASSPEAKRAIELFEQTDPARVDSLNKTIRDFLSEAEKQGVEGEYVLMPKVVFDRAKEHFAAASLPRKTFQVLNSAFKGTVLPLSPKWFLGNFLDVNMRTMFAGTGLYGRNAALGRKLLADTEKLDPALVKRETGLTPEEFRARLESGLVPGAHFGSQDANRVFRDARQFAGTSLEPFARWLGTARRAPGVRQAVNGYIKYRDAAFHFNEFAFERQAQYAVLGKAARREWRVTKGKWHKALRLGDDAVADLAKGLLKTPAQIKYAKAIEDVLGQWTANGPGMRAALVDYAPFGMWARAATRFVLMTLPLHHPIKTGIGAALLNATEDERDALGLTFDWAVKGRLPDNLQGSYPTPSGGIVPVQGLSSFGFFADYQKSLSDMVLPQLPLDSLRGYDWTGQRLQHEDGTPLSAPERMGAVILGTGESFIPFVSLGKRIAEKGPLYALNPVRPYDAGLTSYLRESSERQTIEVPAAGSSSSGDGNVWEAGGSTSGENPWTAGASDEGTNPWSQ